MGVGASAVGFDGSAVGFDASAVGIGDSAVGFGGSVVGNWRLGGGVWWLAEIWPRHRAVLANFGKAKLENLSVVPFKSRRCKFLTRTLTH